MGMSLFDIDSTIRDLLDAMYDTMDDDGVVSDDEMDVGDLFAKIEELNEARDAKIENIALYIKECDAESNALKAESDKLKKRADAAKKKSERLREYLSTSLLNGKAADEKVEFSTTRCKITFRNTKTVIVDDMDALPANLVKTNIDLSPDKTAIKKAIEAGEKINGAHIQTNRNIQIK